MGRGYSQLEAQAVMVVLHHFLRVVPEPGMRVVVGLDAMDDHALRLHATAGFIYARQGGRIDWISAIASNQILLNYLEGAALGNLDAIWETSTAFVSALELRDTLRSACESMANGIDKSIGAEKARSGQA